MSTSSSASTVAESSSTGSGGGTGFKLSWPFVGVGGERLHMATQKLTVPNQLCIACWKLASRALWGLSPI